MACQSGVWEPVADSCGVVNILPEWGGGAGGENARGAEAALGQSDGHPVADSEHRGDHGRAAGARRSDASACA